MPNPPLLGLAWISAQADAELGWILAETLESLMDKGPVNFREVRTALSAVMAPTLVDRDPRLLGKITPAVLETVAWNTFCAQPDGWFAKARRHTIVAVLQEAFLLHAASLLITPKPTPEDTYWPFGQEGGFCNPMKLKILAENEE